MGDYNDQNDHSLHPGFSALGLDDNDNDDDYNDYDSGANGDNYSGISPLGDSQIFSALLETSALMMMMMIIIIITKTMIIMIIIQVLAHLVTVRYSPPSWRPLHWLSLVAAATGVALLLLSRGHYSIGQLILIRLMMIKLRFFDGFLLLSTLS